MNQKVCQIFQHIKLWQKVVTTYFHYIHYPMAKEEHNLESILKNGFSASCAGCDQGQGTHPPDNNSLIYYRQMPHKLRLPTRVM